MKIYTLLMILVLIVSFKGRAKEENNVTSEKQFNKEIKENYCKVLNDEEIKYKFSKKEKNRLGIRFKIIKCFEYYDKSGENYLVLTERENIRGKENKNNDSIVAFNLKIKNGVIHKESTIKDWIIKGKYTEEESIWFWTKYIDVKDYDKDGFMEPIIIYGSSVEDGNDDDRMKMVLYHKGTKKLIRHYNSSLDDNRYTQVDKTIFLLNRKIKMRIRELLIKIENNRHSTFNYIYVNGEKRFQFEEKEKLIP